MSRLSSSRFLCAPLFALAFASIAAPSLALPEPAGAGLGPSPCHGATLTKGQKRIDQHQYSEAIRVFSCVLEVDPISLDAYRGRAEAKLLLGRFSDAMQDYARVTAVVMPVHPDAIDLVFAGYDARLARHPNDVPALTGASFVHWWYFDYAATTPLLDRLLQQRPDDVYGVLYRGSNRLFLGEDVAGGMADFARAIQLAPGSADVHFIVADGYTYAYSDPVRAQFEATLALEGGLDTPRVHAILASSAFALGDDATGAAELALHIERVTTELVATPTLAQGSALPLDLRPGRTYAIPITAQAGELISIRTDSPSGAVYDSLLVLLGPDGTPAVGNDDFIDYFAGFDWVAPQTGTFSLQVTSFEGVSTGDLVVTRP